MSKKEITVALAGNPNSGKTTVFNQLTGARQHVGNYPGVTVEMVTGIKEYKGYKIDLIDLPGTYSLTPYSTDELVARDYIIEQKPDIVLNIIDSSNLERNLYLATQLIELSAPSIFVFNMFDIFEKSGQKIDFELLSELLGAPIVKTVGSKNKGLDELLEKVIEVYEKKEVLKDIDIKYGEEIENELGIIKGYLEGSGISLDSVPSRWIAIKLLEQDSEVIEKIIKDFGKNKYESLSKDVERSIKHLSNIFREKPEIIIADARYGFISGALREATTESAKDLTSISDKIDVVVTNRIFGLVIFALIMWAMFQIVFTVGDYPTRWLELGFIKLAELIQNSMPEGLLSSLIVDGIIGGVGGVIVFTPKIMILFIFIAFLEDSGYMARAAFVMDRIMHKIGLHGKSFIPMLIGFGCTIPGYMCTRTIEDRKDRLITMHINTFMSCGGRLPIYVLFAGAFFPAYSGNVIFSIYLIGIIMAVLVAKFLRATRFKGEAEPFVMELPPYRLPTFKAVMIHTWERTWMYLKKAGTVILAISILMWILFTFPMIGDNYSQDYDEMAASLEEDLSQGLIDDGEYDVKMATIEAEKATEELEYSAAGRIGHFIEPVFKPLGFDWRMAIASVSGIAGKEVVVSTMGTIFSISDARSESGSLRESLSNAYNPLIGYNFMLFSLLYFPCIASMAVFQREAGTKELFFQIGFTLGLAWFISFIVFQIGRLFI